MLYSAFTYFTGFKVNSGEYKVMGLAPYGQPRYVKAIKDHLLEIRDDGSLWMNMEYFTYPHGLTMTGTAFERLFDGPPRRPESKLTQREMDLARSIQEITEEVMLKMARFAHRETGMRDLCLAGGVALNCVGNGRILREGPFEQIWIQPAAGDAGGAVGVALALWHRYLEKPRISPEAAGTWERPSRAAVEAHPAIRRRHARRLSSGHSSRKRRSRRFSKRQDTRRGGSTGGAGGPRWRAAGRAESDRSAAGTDGIRSARTRRAVHHRRCPLAEDAIGDEPQDQVSRIVPAVRAVGASRARAQSGSTSMPTVRTCCSSPTFCRAAGAGARVGSPLWGIEQLNVPRSVVPAITHVDYSARIQTVRRETNPLYYDIIDAFFRRTGCPVIVNTSFNVRGEPIVCTPEDAYRCFMRTNIDVLVLENFVLERRAARDRRRRDMAQGVRARLKKIASVGASTERIAACEHVRSNAERNRDG